MEISYADKSSGGIFETNLIPELTRLAQENEDFSGLDGKLNGAYALTGCTWTMASIFAQSTGLPLNLPLGGNAMDSQDSFLPAIVGIGEILKQHGYTNVLLQGSDATFAGAKNFFRDHGDFKVMDYNYMLKNRIVNNADFTFWGMEDYRLFEIAKKEIVNLYEQKKPFNMTIITIDTHNSNGYLSKYCQQTVEDNYQNAIICSDKQLSDFIQWVQRQDFYDNTTIVITGDHPNMSVGFPHTDNYIRKVYTCYINTVFNGQKNDKYRTFSTFDNFPTTLAALGGIIDGNRLGLGTNLFSELATLSEQLGYNYQDIELYKNSNFLNSIFSFKLTDSMMNGIQNYNPLIYTEYNHKSKKLDINLVVFHVKEGIDDFFIKIFNYDDLKNYKKITLKKVNDFFIPNTNQKAGWYKTDIDIDYQDNNMSYIRFFSVSANGKQHEIGTLQGDLSLKTINLYNYLNLIANKKYTVFVSVKGGINSPPQQEIIENFKKLGLNFSILNNNGCSYIAIINGDNIYEKTADGKIQFAGDFSNNNKFNITSACNTEDDISSIIIDNVEYSHNEKGVNFVIYNNELNRIADISTFDISSDATFLDKIKVR